MGLYYNRTRATLSANQKNGDAVVFPPRTWVLVEDPQESSSSILSLKSKGFLVRRSSPAEEENTASEASPKVEVKGVPEPRSPDPVTSETNTSPALVASETSTMEPEAEAAETPKYSRKRR